MDDVAAGAVAGAEHGRLVERELGRVRGEEREQVGRRVARLSGLTLTGSIGILLKAKQTGYPVSVEQAVERMREHGIWLSEPVIAFALGKNH